MTKLSVSKLVNARSVFESWVMLGWAEVWNELADDAIGSPFGERIANRSSDLAESDYTRVE